MSCSLLLHQGNQDEAAGLTIKQFTTRQLRTSEREKGGEYVRRKKCLVVVLARSSWIIITLRL